MEARQQRPWQQLPSLIFAHKIWLLQETTFLVLNLEPLAAFWVLTLEELSSLAFRFSGHKYGGDAGVGQLHVCQELVYGLRLPDLQECDFKHYFHVKTLINLALLELMSNFDRHCFMSSIQITLLYLAMGQE